MVNKAINKTILNDFDPINSATQLIEIEQYLWKYNAHYIALQWWPERLLRLLNRALLLVLMLWIDAYIKKYIALVNISESLLQT